MLRFLASFVAMTLSPHLPESFIGYNEAGQMIGLAGDAAAVVNCLLFVLAFIIIFYAFGRMDLIQERFSYRVRNANEDVGVGYAAGALEFRVSGKWKRNLFSVLGILVLGIGFSLGCNVLFGLLGLTKASADFQAVAERQMSAGIFTGILLYGICSPLAEELIFRGVVFARLKRYLPVVVSGIVSALLFGIYHGNVVQAIYGFAAGCLFAWFYHKTGSFGQTVLLHGVMNITGFLLTYFGMFDTPVNSPVGCIAAFVLAAIAFWGLDRNTLLH